MSQLFRWFENMLIAVAVSMLLFFVFSVSYQVAARYVDFVPRAIWTEELSRMSFVWMTFLGAAAAVRSGQHFVIDLLPLPTGSWERNIRILTGIIVFLIAAVTFVGSVEFFELGKKRFSSATGVSLAWFYLAIPVSMAFICAFSIENIVSTLRSSTPPEDGQV
jgi:TRAP-type C4-dicarboxylate transport system permease small subunit